MVAVARDGAAVDMRDYGRPNEMVVTCKPQKHWALWCEAPEYSIHPSCVEYCRGRLLSFIFLAFALCVCVIVCATFESVRHHC